MTKTRRLAQTAQIDLRTNKIVRLEVCEGLAEIRVKLPSKPHRGGRAIMKAEPSWFRYPNFGVFRSKHLAHMSYSDSLLKQKTASGNRGKRCRGRTNV
jgi:hypothetical protein